MKSERIKKERRVALASLESLRKIFLIPESESSTLGRIEQEISKNLMGFLKNHIVAGDMDPVHLEKDFCDTLIPEEPMFVSEQANFLLEKVVSQSVHTSSPSFVGHMTSALPYFMLPLAKIMIALNQNLVKIETSKAFTPLERQVLGMLHRLVYCRDEQFYKTWLHNYDHAIACFSSGGTLANITALWTARNLMFGPAEGFNGLASEGLARALHYYKLNGLAILVSKRGHYSLTKAADLLGIGRAFVIGIDTTQDHKIDPKKLTQEIDRLKSENIGILAIVGIAGTTETGSVDPLEHLADIAEEHKCHYHVDAAWGGPTLFSSRYKHLLKGIERADSVTIDCHKQLYVPMGAAVTLFKNPASLSSIEQHAQYVIRKGSRDLGQHTIEGSRAGMAMLVHSSLRIIGKKGFELLIDLGIGKARQFAKMIQAADDFELISEPELNLLTYRYVPKFVKELLEDKISVLEPQKLTAINDVLSDLVVTIQRIQRSRGKTFISRTRFAVHKYNNQEISVFRAVTANPLTTRNILNDILIEQRQIGQMLLEKEGYFGAISGAISS